MSPLLILTSVVLAMAPVGEMRADVGDAQLAPVPQFGGGEGADYSKYAATVLSRPLFVKGRQAILSAESAGAALGDLRLAGTIANSRVRKALFREKADLSDGKRGRWVGVDDEISGWRVTAIEPGQAVLRRGGEEIVLSISKRKALSAKEISQLRAATPILPSAATNPSQAAIDERREAIKDALSKLGEGGLYGTPD
ncbi:MAG: hypothetical protein A3E78_13005 [Alphaproteobacteria bacterium RIFCSPHIGHO2_12_FULL_63_12]|nr:MAG: hypothetical protein A3E78_13005 [Alphaproteobacteria bacterium RIFCSPHIGHO2_12_FULL_63_12]